MSRLVPALALVATTGCLSRPELATNDGGSGDASFDPGLLRNGDFELGCAMWYGADANVVVDQLGHSGAACRVCLTNRPYYYIVQRIDRSFASGDQYLGKAWIRTTGDTPSHPVEVVLELRNSSDTTLAVEGSPLVGPTSTWQELTGIIDVDTSDGTNLLLRVGASSAQGPSCFLVDDVSLHRL